MLPTTTVAILTRNRLPLLQECIAGILPQLLPGDEVLVVDTGSIDGTRAWLTDAPPPVRWVPLDRSATDFGAARNVAVQSAGGDIVAFVDDDCLAQPDWLPSIRKSLRKLDAVGGPALFGRDYRFPSWWSPEMTWTVGMSGPALIRGSVDDYPSTSNMAAWRAQFAAHPFQETPHGFGGGNIYLGGREDAQWWGEARRRGARTGVSLQAVVMHRIPSDRFRWQYIWRRTITDGRSAWNRRPCEETARGALYEASDSLLGAGITLLQASPGALSNAAAKALWAARQNGLARAARNDISISPDLRKALSSGSHVAAMAHSIRRRTAAAVFAIIRRSRPVFQVPEEPRSLLITAPTFLGDSLLLQSAVRLLAQSWPGTRIEIWTPYPDFFRHLGENVTPIDFQDAEKSIPSSASTREYEVVFAPYYEFGSPEVWRKVLSERGVIFDREMGFRRDRDYHLAARMVEKDMGTHELLNLVRLLSLWPMSGRLRRPEIKTNPAAGEALRKRFPVLDDGAPFVTLQMRHNVGMKDWPLKRWAQLAGRFCRESGVRLVLHDPAESSGIGDQVIRMAGLSSDQAVAVDCDLNELTALLGRASLAVGICSGPKHLAMALGTPTFTLYGPTDPVRWGALFQAPRHAWVRSPAGTLTAGEHRCLPPNHAMLQISVDQALETLLAHWTDLQGKKKGPDIPAGSPGLETFI